MTRVAPVNQPWPIAVSLTEPRRRALGVLARRESAWLANVTDEKQGSVNSQAGSWLLEQGLAQLAPPGIALTELGRKVAEAQGLR
jgi:hypothetical protein